MPPELDKYIHEHSLAFGAGVGVGTFILLSLVSNWFKAEKAKGNATFLGYLLNGSKG